MSHVEGNLYTDLSTAYVLSGDRVLLGTVRYSQ